MIFCLPDDDSGIDNVIHRVTRNEAQEESYCENMEEFSIEEVGDAIDKKAPGPDMIEVEIVKRL